MLDSVYFHRVGFSAMAALNSTEEGQDSHSIAVPAVPPCETQLSLINLLEVSETLKHSLSLDAVLNSQIKLERNMENVDIYFPCSTNIDIYFPCNTNIDIERGNTEKPKTKNQHDANVKIGTPLTKTMQPQISIQMGEKIMQMLMDLSLVLPQFNFRDKSVPERVHDIPNNRLRKYKRSASFNSRKVVLLFSVL